MRNETAKLEELGIVAIAWRGQDVVSHDVTNGSPGQNVHDIEPNWVVRFEEADVLLGPYIPCLEMALPVLLGQPLFADVLPLEVEEYEPPQKQGHPCAQAYHQRRVQLRPHRGGSPALHGGCEAAARFHSRERAEALEGFHVGGGARGERWGGEHGGRGGGGGHGYFLGDFAEENCGNSWTRGGL